MFFFNEGGKIISEAVGTGEFESPTSPMSRVRSNQLSYAPIASEGGHFTLKRQMNNQNYLFDILNLRYESLKDSGLEYGRGSASYNLRNKNSSCLIYYSPPHPLQELLHPPNPQLLGSEPEDEQPKPFEPS